jgi:hypothetical protein
MKPQKPYSTSGLILFLLSMGNLGARLRARVHAAGAGIFQQFGFRFAKRRQWTIFSVVAPSAKEPV